ncbi:MAG: hypothetical protein M0D54_10405 [Hyphomonadaceae bacterium JAD_PAG50586_4]|nr:MAG: hypothetical protein M0D54_10405 [Hyphomonadaceae bacterium JAD_PAG50586_4]
MILRRLSEHVKAQNWFAVALDFVIVVLGVFVGLQVDNWSAERQDRIHEERFLQQLHVDLMAATSASQRLLERRMERHDYMISALDVLFEREGRDELTENECQALASSAWYNLVVAELGSVNELTSSGRVGIISDSDLRAELISLQQIINATNRTINHFSGTGIELPHRFPRLMRSEGRFDEALGEVRLLNTCDLSGMRANQEFLNMASTNVDSYDAYIRDAVNPWHQALVRVHASVDALLDIQHEESN